MLLPSWSFSGLGPFQLSEMGDPISHPGPPLFPSPRALSLTMSSHSHSAFGSISGCSDTFRVQPQVFRFQELLLAASGHFSAHLALSDVRPTVPYFSPQCLLPPTLSLSLGLTGSCLLAFSFFPSFLSQGLAM